MKFDVVVGNPPYQEQAKGDGTKDLPIYNYFYDLAAQLSEIYCLITPARFLFNAGGTDKKWNKQMLTNKHLKVEFYEQNSGRIFPGTDIKGGVTIIYYDINKVFDEIGVFTSYPELNSIMKKVKSKTKQTLDSIMGGQGIYKFTPKMHEEHPEVRGILSKTHPNDVGSGVLNSLHNILFLKKSQKMVKNICKY